LEAADWELHRKQVASPHRSQAALRPAVPHPLAAGFLRQLAQYSKSLGVAASNAPHGSASQGAQQAQEPAELALALMMQ
jgi:hypothetical protein